MEAIDKSAIHNLILNHLTTFSFGPNVSGNATFMRILKQCLPLMELEIEANRFDDVKMKSIYFLYTNLSGELMHRLKKDDEKRLCYECCFIMLYNYMTKKENENLFTDVPKLLQAYPSFRGLSASELNVLNTFRNTMKIAQICIRPQGHKGHLLEIVTRISEGKDVKYITGSGQTTATKHRVIIYETEAAGIYNKRKTIPYRTDPSVAALTNLKVKRQNSSQSAGSRDGDNDNDDDNDDDEGDDSTSSPISSPRSQKRMKIQANFIRSASDHSFSSDHKTVTSGVENATSTSSPSVSSLPASSPFSSLLSLKEEELLTSEILLNIKNMIPRHDAAGKRSTSAPASTATVATSASEITTTTTAATSTTTTSTSAVPTVASREPALTPSPASVLEFNKPQPALLKQPSTMAALSLTPRASTFKGELPSVRASANMLADASLSASSSPLMASFSALSSSYAHVTHPTLPSSYSNSSQSATLPKRWSPEWQLGLGMPPYHSTGPASTASKLLQ